MPKTADDVRGLLRDYQRTGIQFLASRPYAILGDDTGLGKSLQTILAADVLKYDRVLILCPHIGLVSWRNELAKWQIRKRAFAQYDKKQTGIPNGPLIYLVPYSQVSIPSHFVHISRMLRGSDAFKVAILDEAHYLSNINSSRTKAVYGDFAAYSGGVLDAARVTSIWVLSGTLQRRDARDLYPHLKALFPDAINDALGHPQGAMIKKREYEDEFLVYDHQPAAFDPRWAKVIGNDNATIPRLRTALKPYILARRKRDVAAELGEVTLIDLPLGIEIDDQDYGSQLRRDDFGKALLEELWAQPNLQGGLVLSEEAANDRRTLGMAKVGPVAEWIDDFFAGSEEKLVVFAWHRDVIRELAERLRDFDPIVIMGGTDMADRQLGVDRFQNDPRYRLFIGQTIAAGTSITLTAASTVLTVEPDWLPHNDYQANSRVHRIGQTEPVMNYRCFVDGTVDRRIISRANSRYADFRVLMDGLVTTT